MALTVKWWLRLLRICLQWGRSRFDPQVRKIPWRREWQPTPVFLPGQNGAWWATVHSAAKRHDWSNLHFHFLSAFEDFLLRNKLRTKLLLLFPSLPLKATWYITPSREVPFISSEQGSQWHVVVKPPLGMKLVSLSDFAQCRGCCEILLVYKLWYVLQQLLHVVYVFPWDAGWWLQTGWG